MHQAVLDQWSRRSSPLHVRDARAKLLAVAVYLVAVATLEPMTLAAVAGFALLVAAAVVLARLPLGALALRATAVWPFVAVFAAMNWVAGDPQRALGLLARSYLSAAAALLLVSTTPLPLLLDGLRKLGAPRLLVAVVQFLYRYLYVLSEQAQHMRLAAASRGAGSRSWRASGLGMRAAAGAVAVLFARSHRRAQGIYWAMLARGCQGTMPALATGAGWRAGDWLLLGASLACCGGLRLVVRSV